MIGELCRQEALKLYTQKFPYLMVAVVVALQVYRMLMLALAAPQTSLDVVTGPQLWGDGLGWALRLMVFVVLVLGAMGFSREFSLGTARTVLVLPVPRRSWLAAKLASLVLLAWGLLLVCGLLGAGIVAATTGWGDVVREGIVIHRAAAFWRDILLALLLTAVYLMPVCAFALLVGLYFSNSGAAVGVAVMLGMVLESAGGMLNAGKYLFLYHLHRPAEMIVRLGKGLPFTWEQALGLGLATALITFAALGLWMLVRLERMDVTA